uniref:Serpin family B member 11 n=1 Tax=Podarcis muralis TaxID=64176 RepID=A0A670IAQ3_PODMU|nr:leukocyte elastase inhibitor-like [Podarcis muralis]
MDLHFTKDPLPTAIIAFGLDLYKKLNRSDTCKNIFFSPISITSALAMVQLGARGSSRTQMEEVLHFNRTLGSARPAASEGKMGLLVSEPEGDTAAQFSVEEGIYPEIKKLLFQLNNLSNDYELNVANNLFMQKGYEFLKQYLTRTKEIFGAIMQTVDFQNATEEARQEINLEVARQTKGNIKDLFPPGIIQPDTVLVLANAVYFKATWEHQFDPKLTTEREFKLNETESKHVQMMHQKGRFKLGYTMERDAQILCLPYHGKVLSMIIILPDDIGNLKQVENTMTSENLAHWTASENLTEENVEVYLPQFKLEESFDLNSPLQALGMIDVFDRSRADLSGMAASNQLYLSKVLHKAFVDVDEVGTKAAAATGAVVSNRSLPSYKLFEANHPFLFCIRHNPSDAILFLGKLCSP